MTRDRPSPRWWQRLLQRLPSTRPGAWLFSRVFHRIDTALLDVSGGRVTLGRLLAGIPVVELTTVGAKTGRERTAPLLGLPDGERWVLFASNWGSDAHPAWYHNLRANPAVELTYEGRTAAYTARDATDEERATYWEAATELYVGFEAYRQRADRQIPVVVLEPAGESDGDAAPDQEQG